MTLAIATGLLVVPVAALAAKHNGHQHAPGPGGGHPSQPWHPGAQGGHPGAPGGHPGSQGDHQPGGQDGGPGGQPGAPTPGALTFEVRSLDGSGNNPAHTRWGEAGTQYLRVAPAAYADGSGSMASGPNPRYVSNRVFNDVAQNLFSENNVSQWVWTWGQFMDHTFGLAEGGGESASIAFDPNDPLESFRNDFGVIPFSRDLAAPGTGTSPSNPRQQVNTVSSFIDGWSVYGGTEQRLEWLRVGSVDGNLANNGARLLLTSDGYLPPASTRGDAASAPEMVTDGQLAGHPQDAVVAGDVRADENIALTAVHTLFAREHDRIVDLLPATLTDEQKFQIARRVVGAEQQYVTYREFLPTLGVRLAPYSGYKANVNPTLGNEFAAVGYRAHSMIHGEFELNGDASEYTPGELASLEQMGVEVEQEGSELEFTVPLNVAFFDPDLVPDLGLDSILAGLGSEAQYKNDEQIDNALRSVLFQVPGPNAPNPTACFQDPSATGCYQGVVDLGAIDVQRGRDHGIPSYDRLRRAFGLRPARTFRDITGERTDRFPSDPEITGNPIDDPDILDFTALFDAAGDPIPFGTEAAEEDAVVGIRRTTLAARLRAIYGSVNKVDPFVGMVAEQHVRGTEFGRLQLAMWKQQFEALRDGDRFFYTTDPALEQIRRRYGITYRHRLSELIALNTDVPAVALPQNVFLAP